MGPLNSIELKDQSQASPPNSNSNLRATNDEDSLLSASLRSQLDSKGPDRAIEVQVEPLGERIEPRQTVGSILNSTDGWLTEIICWILSVGCLIGLICLLRVYNDGEVPKWDHHLTLNTVIAVFATAAKVLLMKPVTECISQLKWVYFAKNNRSLGDFEVFDNASRGEFGSLLFLGRLPRLKLATLGAIVTVAALATSTLTQQVATYPIRLVPISNSPGASSSIALNYTASRSSELVLVLDVSKNEISSSLKAAVFAGIYTDTDIDIDIISPICSTSNCTWPAYRTLGICQNLADLTNDTTTVFINTDGVTTGANISLPNGHVLDMQISDSGALNITSGLSSIAFSNISLPLLDFSMIFDYSKNGSASNISAVEGVLYFCVQEYTTVVENGVILDSYEEIPSTFNYSSTAGGAVLQALDQNQTFWVGGEALGVTQQYLAGYFSGEEEDGMMDGSKDPTDQLLALQTVIYRAPENLDAMKQLMKNMATSMTNTIRSGTNGTDVALGTAFTPQAYVKIHLQWLSFVAALILASGVFLCFTIFQTWKVKTGVWKSSVMATLQGLDNETRHHLGTQESTSGMQKKAKEMTVKLESNIDGTKLVIRDI